MTLEEGASLGRYRLVKQLRRGGMGEVWQGYDTQIKRDVAIKVLSGADQKQQDHWRREWSALGSVNHVNVIKVFDVGEGGGYHYAVMELLDGTDLERRLRSTGRLGAAPAARLAYQVACGLAAAHHARKIHRDLKPANVFVSTDDEVKLLDFGIVQDLTASAVPTSTSAIRGTLGYMAPEQLNQGPTDERTDLFALGAILYEMLSGRRAFEGDELGSVLYATVFHEPLPLDGDVPADLQMLVSRCLAKEPGHRPPSADEVARELGSIVERLGRSSTVSLKSTSTHPHLPSGVGDVGTVMVLRVWGKQRRYMLAWLRRYLGSEVCYVDCVVSMAEYWEAVAASVEVRGEKGLRAWLRKGRDRRLLLAEIRLPADEWKTFGEHLGRMRRLTGVVLLQACNPFHVGRVFRASSFLDRTRAHSLFKELDWDAEEGETSPEKLLSELGPCCLDVVRGVIEGRGAVSESPCSRELVAAKLLTANDDRLELGDSRWQKPWKEALRSL